MKSSNNPMLSNSGSRQKFKRFLIQKIKTVTQLNKHRTNASVFWTVTILDGLLSLMISPFLAFRAKNAVERTLV